LLSGWSGFSAQDVPETVYLTEALPHSWLFRQVAAVVHHGGAGTTAAGLRAGVPSILIPFFGDQAFWGHRVFELGVGPKPMPRKQLTAELLANAIQLAVNDTMMQEQAAKLGTKIQNEDGIARAVELIEQFHANAKV
jgi:UDP:flavonoid glycosyltransferase YjiC (YdhE family)